MTTQSLITPPPGALIMNTASILLAGIVWPFALAHYVASFLLGLVGGCWVNCHR